MNQAAVANRDALEVRDLNFYNGRFQGVRNVNRDIEERKATAFIGPSGCGKSTLLRTFNRMYSLYSGQKATGEIEELVHELARDDTIAIVTHDMQQAARVSDYTAVMFLGELIEFSATDQMFTKPEKTQTEDYITSRFG